ncbi:MAG TPA: MarR family transcriptional regulator [Pseudonocardiaceae bacterium]
MEPEWLTPDELRSWIAFMGVFIKLPYLLDVDLKRKADLNFVEYLVLSALSVAPDRELPMNRLATVANCSLSRLSHVVGRLEKREWVHRFTSPCDGRLTIAALTDDGYELLRQIAPGHVATVRGLVYDSLTPDQVDQFTAICDKINKKVDPGGTWPPRARPSCP